MKTPLFRGLIPRIQTISTEKPSCVLAIRPMIAYGGSTRWHTRRGAVAAPRVISDYPTVRGNDQIRGFLFPIYPMEIMETLTLIFFFATMGLFILSSFKRRLSTISLMFLLGAATLALTLSDPTLNPETDNVTYMIMLILDALFILWGMIWAMDPNTGKKG